MNIKSQSLINYVVTVVNKDPNDIVEKDLDMVKDITLNCSDISGEFSPVFIEDIAKFDSLESLSLSYMTLDKKGMETISSRKNLKRLSFFNCDIENFAEVSKLKNLEKLEICRTPVSNFTFIKNLNLEMLKLIGLNLKDLNFVKDISNIHSLEVLYSNVNDKKLPSISDAVQINISGTDFDNLEELKNMPNLKKVSLNDVQLKKYEASLKVLLLKNKHLEIYDEYRQPITLKVGNNG